MNRQWGSWIFGLALVPAASMAQSRSNMPDVSPTFKGTLMLPIPLGMPLFNDITEVVGLVDGMVQVPLYKGVGIGAGARMNWFGIKERALSPIITGGDIRRATFHGKLQYEQYTGPRTFYELNARGGVTTFNFICRTCTDDSRRTVPHWGIGVGYYVHVSDNLAFGFTLGYERDATRFSASDLGLENFPGRIETQEARDFQMLTIGMGFSTRFRRSAANSVQW
jgi:hypothetical protein